MPTTVRNASTPVNNGETIRVIGKIAKPLVEKVSKGGKAYFNFLIVVDDQFGNTSWVNATMFPDLHTQVPDELLKPGAYAKFVGKGSTRPWTDNAGKQRINNDMLVSGIELQNGTFIKGLKEKEHGQDEDAPF